MKSKLNLTRITLRRDLNKIKCVAKSAERTLAPRRAYNLFSTWTHFLPAEGDSAGVGADVTTRGLVPGVGRYWSPGGERW